MGQKEKGSILTETICDKPIVISAQDSSAKENIVTRKTIVYETLVDTTVIRVASEKLKLELFTRFGLLKPKPEEIQFVSIDKYYEPFIVVSGKYSIDYYRKCTYNIGVDDVVVEVILLDNKFVPHRPASSNSKDCSTIRLEGEERIINQAKASFIFDKYGRDASLEKLPSAPSEKKPKKVITKFGIEEIPQNTDVDYVRNKLFKRPNDIKRVVSEIFEVGERVVIYVPRFRIVYKNAKTSEEKIMEFDGVTSERIQQKQSAFAQSVKLIKSRLQ